MSRNAYARELIVERASELASRLGLTGLTIGSLAQHLHRPKSSVFFHFRSKETLQLVVLEHAAREFARDVVRPAVRAGEGLPGITRLFEGWLAWDRKGCYPGGCLFAAAASEFDDRPGPVRDRLLLLHRAWLHLLRRLVKTAIATGAFRPDTDANQFLLEFHGIMLAFRHSSRLLEDPAAERRALRAFEGLVGRVKGAG
jgi:AcrR family transcriptional regulator